MLAAFFLVFSSIALAQMGDKTQLITIILATRTKKHPILFLSIMSGFAVGVSIAVIFGAGIASIIPHTYIKVASGGIFVALGTILFLNSTMVQTVNKKKHYQHHFLSTAFVILLADFGDKTQIALALFSATYHPFVVFAAGLLALGLDTFVVMYFSKRIAKHFNEKTIEKLASVSFILVGVFLLLRS